MNTGAVSNNSNMDVNNHDVQIDKMSAELVEQFKSLSFKDKAEVMNLIIKLNDKNT